MEWPLESTAISRREIPYFNLQYIHTCPAPADPTMVWGTEVDMRCLEEYVARRNRDGRVLLSPAHVLVQAAGRALARFPQLNARVVGRRLFRYRDFHVAMSVYDRRSGEVNVVRLENVDEAPLEAIAQRVWQVGHEALRGKLPLQRDKRRMHRLPSALFGALLSGYLWVDRRLRLPATSRITRALSPPLLVNYLGFAGAPPMRTYKPARFPAEGQMLNVVLGPTEQKPVAEDGQVVIRPMAPLFVRGDHRTADAYLLGRFVETIRELLSDPARMESIADERATRGETRRAA